MRKSFIAGPSGAGKTFVVESLRNADGVKALDLDVLGYRTTDDWKEWIIPPECFGFLDSAYRDVMRHLLVAGASSYFPDLYNSAVKSGFDVLFLIPSAEVLAANRTTRGDKPEKVADAEKSVVSWTAISQEHRGPVFDNTKALLKHLTQ